MNSENNEKARLTAGENLPRRAAVLIPIVREKEGPAILLEVRSMNVWQPGEVCFPGGHVEEGETGVETAIRETREELGIPASSIRVRKEMEPERHIRDMLVYPVLADIDPFEPDRMKLLAEEVTEVFTLPVDWLLAHEPDVYEIDDPASEDLPLKLRQYLKNYENKKKHRTNYWEYGPYGIWGFTARLLVRIREMLLLFVANPQVPCYDDRGRSPYADLTISDAGPVCPRDSGPLERIPKTE